MVANAFFIHYVERYLLSIYFVLGTKLAQIPALVSVKRIHF